MFPVEPDWEELVPGRAAVLRLRGNVGGLDAFTIHLEPALSPSGFIAQLSLLRAAIKPYSEAHTLLAGDWNFNHDVEDRFNAAAGTFCGKRQEVAEWWDSNYRDVMEWF